MKTYVEVLGKKKKVTEYQSQELQILNLLSLKPEKCY